MTHLPCQRAGTRARLIGCCLIATVPLSVGSAAYAKTDFVVNAAISARAADNPFLVDGSKVGSASAVVSISPALTVSDAESDLTLFGVVQHSEYQRLYGSTDSVSAGVNGRWRFSPRWTANASAAFDDSIVGENDRLNFGNTPEPVVGQPAIGDDLAFIGTRTKRRTIGVQAGLGFQPNAREVWNLGLFANNSRSLGVINDQNYSTYGGMFSYSRQVSRRSSAGLSTTVSRYECRSAARCYVNSFQPQVTFSTVVGIDWTLKASGGATFSRIELPSQSSNTVSPAGSVSLCRDKTRLTVCVTASRTIENNAGSGARPTLAVLSSINYRLEKNTNVGLYLSYNRSGASAFSQQDYAYFSAHVAGSRQIARRVSFTVDGGVDRSETPTIGSRRNISASIGLNFSLGRGA